MPNKKINHGFTLIEMMIVVVILGIIATMAVLAMGNIDSESNMKTAALKLNALMQFAKQYAMLKPQQLGLMIDDHDYQFVAFHPDNANKPWQIISTSPLNGLHVLSDHLTIKILNRDAIPPIVFYSTGEITPFTLIIENAKHTMGYKIVGLANGNIALQKA
ncbi:MAG: type II secretion system minor pseudopilin GspH [Legionellales bacterium]|nr:type II secretion system minor pseudopilin GspH [Legionellales bacterium]